MGNDLSDVSCRENGGENSGENDIDRAPTQEPGERAVDENKTLVEPTDDNNKKEKNKDEKEKCNKDDHGTSDETRMHNESIEKKRSPNNAVNTSSKHKKRKPNNQLREERAPALLHNQIEDFFCHERAFHHTLSDNTVVPCVLPLKHVERMCVCGNHFDSMNKSVHAF